MSSETRGGSLGVGWALAGVAQTIAPTLATSFFAFGVSIGYLGHAFAVSRAIAVVMLPLAWLFNKTTKE